MPSLFENLPCELLQRVALECAGSSTSANPLVDVTNLMLVNRTMYATMSFRQHPHLYGNIFRSRFNVEAPLRRHKFITDYGLSSELFQRITTLQHVRNFDFSPDHVCQDLWTIHNMLMESEGLNHYQLFEAGIKEYLIQLLRSRVDPDGWPLNDAVDCFACCCLNLTMTQGAVVDAEYKRRVKQVIRPFTFNVLRPNIEYQAVSCQVKMYGKDVIIHPPRSASVAIRLLMLLVEELPLQKPSEDDATAHGYKIAPHHIANEALKRRSVVFDGAYNSFFGAKTCFESSMSTIQNHRLAGYWTGTYLVAPFLLTETGCRTNLSPTTDYVARNSVECLLEHQNFSAPIEGSSDPIVHNHQIGLLGTVGDFEWEGNLSDRGLVTLRRSSLYDPFEVWLFEGYMYNNGVLLGRWTSGLSFSTIGDRLTGIFILHKES